MVIRLEYTIQYCIVFMPLLYILNRLCISREVFIGRINDSYCNIVYCQLRNMCLCACINAGGE